jgi:hypothetical protein
MAEVSRCPAKAVAIGMPDMPVDRVSREWMNGAAQFSG